MALTREHVVTTAVSVLRDFGLADLSMRRLARELEVQVGALYWHVKNKQELLVDVAAQLLGGIPTGSPAEQDTTTARAAVVDLATAIRTALVPVPDSAEVIQLAQSMQPAALAPLTRLRDLLESAGVGAGHSAWAQHLVLNHILGSVAAEQERARLESMAAGDPAIPGGPPLGADAFAWGLGAILDGALPRQNHHDSAGEIVDPDAAP
ncbi:TetR/AcrR family transcriptional regulator [Arthrobacter sp. JSM 101049]|uniref:TetR/AcrR family transcriptional regulator n=1 Tax=Arthrobacter sp. JSM 101049 TaxID=929097 RepID=UPI0035666BA8